MTKMGTQVNYTNQDQSFIVGKFKINYDSEVNTHYTVISSRNSFKTVMLRSLSRFNIYKKIIVKKSLDTVTLTFPPHTMFLCTYLDVENTTADKPPPQLFITCSHLTEMCAIVSESNAEGFSVIGEGSAVSTNQR